MTVQFLNAFEIVSYILCSVSTSILAVASSIKIILLFLSIALAIHNNYFSPALKLSPPSYKLEYNPFLFSVNLSKQQSNKTYLISSSEHLFNGSKLSRIVPLKITASYIMLVIDSLNYYKDIFYVSISSIKIYPSILSNNLRILIVIVDLPAPVRPTIPILSIGLILNDILFKAYGRFYLY